MRYHGTTLDRGIEIGNSGFILAPYLQFLEKWKREKCFSGEHLKEELRKENLPEDCPLEYLAIITASKFLPFTFHRVWTSNDLEQSLAYLRPSGVNGSSGEEDKGIVIGLEISDQEYFNGDEKISLEYLGGLTVVNCTSQEIERLSRAYSKYNPDNKIEVFSNKEAVLESIKSTISA